MTTSRVFPFVRGEGGTADAPATPGCRVEITDVPARHFPVGRLVPLEQQTEGKHPLDMRREVTDADVEDVAATVVDHLVEHGVDNIEIVVGTAGPTWQRHGSRIAAALRSLCDVAGISYDEPTASATPAAIEHLEQRDALGTAAALAIVEKTVQSETPVTVPIDVPQGPRIAGIDPGQAFVAVTIAEGEKAPLRFVAGRVFAVGRLVPLTKPRITKRADGSELVRTTRREIADADMFRLARDVAKFLLEHDVSRIVVERATHFQGGRDATPARAAGLARSQWVGGYLAGAVAMAPDVDDDTIVTRFESVTSVSSAVWRAAAKRATGAPTWRAAVEKLYGTSWPKTPGEHVVDAAGAAAWLVTEPKKRAPRVAGTSRRSSAAAHARRAEERAAKRAAIGCTCNGRARHKRDCPANAKIEDVSLSQKATAPVSTQ